MQRYLWIGTLALTWALAGRAGENPAEKKPDAPLRFEGETTPNDPPDAVKPGPAKVHVVSLVKGRAYIIDLVSTDFDAFLRLEDPSGKQFAQDDDGGGKSNARLRFTAPADGKYRLIATAYDQKTGRYVLTVQPQPSALDLNRVHTVAADGISTTGELVESDPRDREKRTSGARIYRFRLLANKTYTIDLKSTEFDAFLRLEDAIGKQLAWDDDGGGGVNSRIVFRCPRDGVYQIIVTSFEPRSGEFTLSVRPGEAKP